jgi:tryptophanyl-tRNA synthetase
MDLLILDILGKDNPSAEGLHGGDCFQVEEAVVDQQQAKLPTSVLLADMPSTSVRDENRHTYTGLRNTMHVTH